MVIGDFISFKTRGVKTFIIYIDGNTGGALKHGGKSAIDFWYDLKTCLASAPMEASDLVWISLKGSKDWTVKGIQRN